MRRKQIYIRPISDIKVFLNLATSIRRNMEPIKLETRVGRKIRNWSLVATDNPNISMIILANMIFEKAPLKLNLPTK